MSQTKRRAGATRAAGRPWLLIALLVLGAAAIGYLLLARGTPGGAADPLLDAAELPQEPQELVRLAAGIDLGREDAPIRILNFVDFQCPTCRWFATDVEPLLREHYVETGKIRLTHYDFPLVSLHRHAFVTARAARCANDQDRFWEYHDLLFARQQLWTGAGAIQATLVDYAGELGLDRAAFAECLSSDRHARTVSASHQLGQQLGVTGTPTLFMDGRALPLLEWPELRAMLDAALGS